MVSANSTERLERPGFTIAEVLMVILLIGLLASVGGGIWVGTYKGLLVEKAARELVLTAKYARVMAIEQQRPYKITLDPAKNGFYISTSRYNAQTERTEQTIVKDYYSKPVSFEGDVRFEKVSTAPASMGVSVEDQADQTIVFLPDGTAQQAAIQIGDGQTHYSVGISAATGKAKMYYGTMENVKIVSTDLDAK